MSKKQKNKVKNKTKNKKIVEKSNIITTGLSDKEVKFRIDKNQINYDTSVPTKSIKQIIQNNFFTLFNLINLVLGIAVFSVGSYKNMLFLFVIILNTSISTFQEIHSKKIIDKLSVLSASKSKVLRNSKEEEISINEIVLDDILILTTGNQISTDCKILDNEVEVDESFITGESNTIFKQKGDTLLSGSFIVSGTCKAQVKHVGEDNYTAQISSDSKYIKQVNSEIMKSLKQIIKILTIAIIPIGILMFINQMNLPDVTYKDAVISTVASIIGMIPEGLVLLTSTVLAVSVIRLSKSNVLVQELYCIETLARVDTLCLDKTGTLTEGTMEVKDFIPINTSAINMQNILANISKNSIDTNSTINAVKSYFTNIKETFTPNTIIPFSSKSKWSGINFKDIGSYIIGAPEFVLKNDFDKYKDTISKYSEEYRVIVLAHSKNDFKEKELPENLELLGLILIADKIRPEASQTLKYFKNQGVDIKIISGDNPITVSKIGKKVGLKNYNNYIDMSTIETEEELNAAANNYTIFGRVSPNQKKSLVVALQNNGKTVAMTGDGVNDVLALKQSDCSIAMANGSDATKNVSQLVLLDSNFASMPKVVAEGRRTINNIQRSASLFLVKTIYSTILALIFLFMHAEYPFQPVQLSLISIVTIGIPSFVLALEPNKERIKGNFLKNVISKSLPTAFTTIITLFSISILTKYGFIAEEYQSTLSVIAAASSGFILLFTLCKTRKSEEVRLPISVFRLILTIFLIALFVFGLTRLNWLFNIEKLTQLHIEIIKIIFLSLFNFTILSLLCKKILKIDTEK